MENKQANTTLKQNKSSTPSIEETLKKFFDGSVTVFESGSDENRPKHYQDRPGIKVIAKSNEGKTIYFQPSENEGATTVTVNKPENEAILDTDNHKMFERMQKRFRNIKKEITILIIDPDVIRA
ncbi:MAG: hypothetical protein KAJ75_09965, partial [Alphaproteobacteria bacterium]|nr:hypothetical protein [Alphaproteobacteria bacterium]